MVKQSVLPMGIFFTRERFGKPQVLAAMLLLAFVAECGWLIAHEDPAAISAEEYSRVQEGLAQWQGRLVAGTPGGPHGSEAIRMPRNAYDSEHSPLWYLVESAPLALFRLNLDSRLGLWLSRLPYVLIGALLGASLWYVSRRLYGNAGGYIALSLYCFSPAVIAQQLAVGFSTEYRRSLGHVWCGIHRDCGFAYVICSSRSGALELATNTCYWEFRWRWPIGSQFGLAIVLPLLLIFMVYLAPEREGSALAILTASLGVAMVLIFSTYFFHPVLFWRGITNAIFLDASERALAMSGAYLQLGKEIIAAGPVLALLVPSALVTYLAWPRSRYFGNTAPGVLALLFMILRVASPHSPESVFTLLAAVFLFVFVAGIAADLLETKARELSLALIVGLVAANAVWNLIGLARLGR